MVTKEDEALIKRAFSLYGDKTSGKVKTTEKPWIVKDDQGVPSYGLLPPPVVVSLIKQLADLF